MNATTDTRIRRIAVLGGPAESGSNMIWSRQTHGRAARARAPLSPRPSTSSPRPALRRRGCVTAPEVGRHDLRPGARSASA